MTNEQYLVVSYFCVALVSLAIGFGAFLWLRKSFGEVAHAMPWKVLREVLIRLFPVGIVFPALMGFLTVNYIGCNKNTYEKVVANRAYLEDKNAEQISASLTHVVWAVFIWCALIAILLAVKQRIERRAGARSTDGS
jgi:hypothetical protein